MRKSASTAHALVAVVVGLMVGGAFLACAPTKKPKKKAKAAATQPQRVFSPSTPGSFVALAKELDPSVVTIRSSHPRQGGPFDGVPGDDPSGGASLGSGFLVDQDGYILTNNHVIEGASDITVTLSDGQEFRATVVGTDEKTDIGVLKIDGSATLVPARLGDSDKLEVGEWVVAIGNPFGLEHTVTAGIVSAKNRTTRDVPLGPGKNYNWNFIQTDASINPGNSGGPLINTAAEVIGINTAIDMRGGGIGYAIPINMAKQLLPLLKKDGKVTRAWMGVYIAPVTHDHAQRIGLDPARGVLIVDVELGGPAARGGMKRGDVVLKFEGQPVDEKNLAFVVSTAGIDRDVKVTVWRDGREQVLDVRTARQP